jgi:hypothetical protein
MTSHYTAAFLKTLVTNDKPLGARPFHFFTTLVAYDLFYLSFFLETFILFSS